MNGTKMALMMMLAAAVATAAGAQEVPTRPPGRPGLPSMPGKQPPPPGKGKTGDQLVKVRGMADTQRVRPGESFRLAFIFEIEPGWHIYWANPGASGGPTEIHVNGPQGYAIGKTLYPRPTIFSGEEGATYGYAGKTVLFVDVSAPPDISAGQAMFTAQINWMVCKDVCLLGRTTQIITVPTGSVDMPKSAPLSGPIDPAVIEYQKRLPQPLKPPHVNGAQAKFEGGTLTSRLVAAATADTAEFFPLQKPGVTYGEASVKKDGEALMISVPVTVDANNALGKAMSIAGTVGLGTSPTEPCYDFEIPLPAT